MRKPLIAGIDPGTTSAYALIDLDKNIVKINSSKQLDTNSMIREITKEGEIIIVGTDKSKTPKTIEKIAARTGAKIIKPKQDLKTEEKKELIENYEVRNEHEKDALAAAIHAYRQIIRLIKKVERHLEKQHKEELKEEIIKLAIRDERGIADSIRIIETAPEERKEKRKRLRTGKIKIEEIYEDAANLKEEDNLRRKLEKIKQNINAIIKAKTRKTIKIKDKKIEYLLKKIKEQEQEIKRLNTEVEKIKGLIKESEKNIITKKIKNLSWENIKEEKLGRIIYVEDPNIYSEKSIEKIDKEVSIIISKETSKKLQEKFKTIFIGREKLGIEEYDEFIVINKENLEKVKKELDIIKKIIEEYRETRK